MAGSAARMLIDLAMTSRTSSRLLFDAREQIGQATFP
jgi:hypothetical protein